MIYLQNLIMLYITIIDHDESQILSTYIIDVYMY